MFEFKSRYAMETIKFSLDQDYPYHLYIKAMTDEGIQVIGAFDFKNKYGSILSPIKGDKKYKQWNTLLKELLSYRNASKIPSEEVEKVAELVKMAKKEVKKTA